MGGTKLLTFVGRKELLAQLLQRFENTDGARMDLVTGVLGMGKSSLLEQAKKLAIEDDVFDALYVDLEEYDTGVRVDAESDPSFGDVLEEYNQISKFVETVLRGLAKEAVGKLEASRSTREKRLHNIKINFYNTLHVNADFKIGDDAKVSGSGQDVTVKHTPKLGSKKTLEIPFIQETRARLTEEADILVAALNGRSEKRPALLLIDNAHFVAGRKFGYWLSQVIKRLRGMAVVIAQDAHKANLLPFGNTSTPIPLLPLTEMEVKELLNLRLIRRPIPEELASILHEFSGGVPVAAETLIDLLNDEGVELEVSELKKRLTKLPSDLGALLDGVVSTLVDHYKGRPLGRALRAASIPERCDVELLGKLLSAGNSAEPDAGDLLEQLGALSFTAAPSPSKEPYYVEVHPFIRRGLAETMRKYAPAEKAHYHQIVTDHYYHMITGADSYEDMFKFEDPEQQALMRQWLAHLGKSADIRTSLLQGARIFLDDMWWWGNYVESDFSEKLVADFEARAEESKNQKFTDFARLVRQFLDHYPFRARLSQKFEYGYPPAEWNEVQEALLNMQNLCELVDVPDEPSQLESHVIALTEVFMAHSFRYASEPDWGEAIDSYDRAFEYFRRLGRWWDLPWVTYESADVSLDSGNLQRAKDGATLAAKQLYEHLDKNNPDEEVIANLHRLLADCAWKEGDISAAAAQYGRAVRHAYFFHRIGGPPDDYTMQFYFEIRGRALMRLVSLWERGEEKSAIAAAQAMERGARGRASKSVAEETIANSLRSGHMADLALALFPRGPDVGELGRESSPFLTELLQLRRVTRKSSEYDLPQAHES